MKRYNVAVVGATGLVGEKVLQILRERKFPIDKLVLLASHRSAGKVVRFDERTIEIQEITLDRLRGIEIAFFAAGAAVSKEYAPLIAKSGGLVIDKSSAWRMDPNVPLVVPEVNREDIFTHQGIIAAPNCSTTQMVMVLKPLHDAYQVKRSVVSSYQSVSGSGKKGMNQLLAEIRGETPEQLFYPHPIALNILPQIDSFLEDGYTREEEKMSLETQKILHDHSILISATTVRVPVMVGHSESLNVEFNKDFRLEEVRQLLSHFPGITVQDDPAKNIYPMPLPSADTDDVYVGRIRRDPTVPSGLNMWIVSDNLRKGAATNAIQIAEEWLRGK